MLSDHMAVSGASNNGLAWGAKATRARIKKKITKLAYFVSIFCFRRVSRRGPCEGRGGIACTIFMK